MTYEELLEKARETYESEDTPHVVKAWLLANIIGPADESEDERIRKGLVKAFGTIGKKDWGGLIVRDILAWLEKQGEQTQLDYEHADIPQKDFAPIEHKMLNADEVIGWLNHRELGCCDVVTTVIPDDSPTSIPHRVKWLSDEFIEQFKQDFGL